MRRGQIGGVTAEAAGKVKEAFAVVGELDMMSTVCKKPDAVTSPRKRDCLIHRDPSDFTVAVWLPECTRRRFWAFEYCHQGRHEYQEAQGVWLLDVLSLRLHFSHVIFQDRKDPANLFLDAINGAIGGLGFVAATEKSWEASALAPAG